MTIASNYPGIRPSLLLDFANTKQLDPRVTFSRASTGTYFDSNGVLQTAAAGVARFDHDPITGESKGFLIEEQRSNLLTYSEQFNDAIWSKTNATITANTIVAPDGTLTGDKLVENTSSSVHVVLFNNTTTAASTTSTLSVFAKAAELTCLRLVIADGTTGTDFCQANFDLGAISVTVANNGIGSGAVGTINSVGNGWYRLTLSGKPSTSSNNTRADIYLLQTQAGAASYTGNGYSGLYIWGAQLEAGAFPTSYIPTVASQVTRSADAASMTGANFTSWYRADEGTLYAEAIALNSAGSVSQAVVTPTNSIGDTRFIIFRGSNTLPSIQVDLASVNQAALTGSAWSNGSSLKISFAYKVNDFAASFGGNAVLTDTNGLLPIVDRLFIGDVLTTTRTLNGTIKRLAFYPKRLSNTELQGITS